MQDTRWLDHTEYPFASRFFTTPAGRLHYLDQGSGPPVVMVHGNPTWSFLWRHLVRHLQAGHRCIAPDLIGFGLSDQPRDWSYRPADHAAVLAALLDHLDLDDLTLVLTDWGGPLGLAWAVGHPERVSRLVLTNTWAWPVDRDLHFAAFSAIMGGPLGRWLIRRYNFFAGPLLRLAFGDRSRLDAEAHRHYLQPLADPRARRGCELFPGQIVAATPWLADLEARLPILAAKPALLVWGMKDIAFREKELRRWQALFPAARAVRLAGVGHFVAEEAPGELARAMDAFFADT